DSVFSRSEITDEQSTQESKTTVQKPQKKRQKREEQVAGLDVVTTIYRRESDFCPFGHKLKMIGKKSLGKKLRYQPAKLWVEDQYLETYTCDCEDCVDQQAGGTAFYSAQAPGNLFLHSSITAELLSNIVYQKYSLGTPLYRQLKDWQRLGWKTSESTLSRAVINGSKLLQPLAELIHSELLKAPYLQGDETVVQVLREPGKKASTESRMWVLRTPQTAQHQGIYYAYQPDRTAKSGQKLYAGFSGVLQCDGYSVYSSVDCCDRVGCLAHVRRKFFEAAKRDQRAKKPLKMLNQMFKL
ncbi:IS66 family transposase, partial [Ligilactobacillus salitolerans]|uniref:IS66 family transposase n=2 Tax=Ligilactobacillus salitolerans TaxID=1808352 RepID=UPI000F605BBB